MAGHINDILNQSITQYFGHWPIIMNNANNAAAITF